MDFRSDNIAGAHPPRRPHPEKRGRVRARVSKGEAALLCSAGGRL